MFKVFEMNVNQVTVNLGPINNTCFVIMPFHSLYELEYERVIRPAIEEAGLTCIRGDEIYTEQAIIQDIWKSIRQARVIVAELSDRNPNVMYETGLAHALGKPIIMLTRNEKDVPFDLRPLRYIYYDPNNPFWGEDLSKELTKQLRNIMSSSLIGIHLAGIEVKAQLPEMPEHPIQKERHQNIDFSGVWTTSWLSISAKREHKATLVVPPNHGQNFITSLTITFEKKEKITIVQENMAANINNNKIKISGINYIYIEQGNSNSYSLDSFNLEITNDRSKLYGSAILKNGNREVVFEKLTQDSHSQQLLKEDMN